jgi:hypothetical protein
LGGLYGSLHLNIDEKGPFSAGASLTAGPFGFSMQVAKD